jgi:hypothetical protein
MGVTPYSPSAQSAVPEVSGKGSVSDSSREPTEKLASAGAYLAWFFGWINGGFHKPLDSEKPCLEITPEKVTRSRGRGGQRGRMMALQLLAFLVGHQGQRPQVTHGKRARRSSRFTYPPRAAQVSSRRPGSLSVADAVYALLAFLVCSSNGRKNLPV